MDNVICAQRKQQRQELAGNTLIALIYWYSFYHYTFDVMFAVMPFVLVLAIMGVTALINGIQYIGLEMWVKRIRQEWKSGKKEPDYVSGYVMSTRWGYSCFTLLLVSMAAYWTEMAWIIPVVLVWFGLIFLAQMIVEMVRPDREIKWILIAAECVAMLVLFYIGFFWMSDIVRQPVPLDLPLVCEDLWPGQETAGSDSGIARSFLGSRLYYYCPVNDENLVQIDNGLWYDRYDSRYGWVLDRIWEIKMQDFDGREMNPSEIQKAETVWESRDRTRWLVRYPDRIVNLESAQVLDYSEFQLVWETFGNGSDN